MRTQPDDCLADTREAMRSLTDGRYEAGTPEHAEAVALAVENFGRLDDHLTGGGAFPAAWTGE